MNGPAAVRAASPAPSFEYADDPRSYELERRIHYRRLAKARALLAPIVNRPDAPQQRPTRVEFTDHNYWLDGYARKAMDMCLIHGPAWTPGSIFCNLLRGRSITWAQLQQRIIELGGVRS